MDLVCLGLNHETAPVEVRERFAVPAEQQGVLSRELLSLEGVHEAVVLSTCNRTEVYLGADQADLALQLLHHHFVGREEITDQDRQHFYNKTHSDAVRHLCRVASGLDSMVLGETEIFGQVKKAYQSAHEESATGKMLNKLFQRIFGIGKKVRTQTTIQQGQTSIGSVAVDLAERIFSHLKHCEVMVIGAGEMSRITAQSMQLRGTKKIYVTNRTVERAQELADELDGEAIAFDAWEQVLPKVDIVVSSTGASEPILLSRHIESVRKKRKYRPLFLIDIAMPRDIDPLVAEIDEVYLYDLDSLQTQAERGMKQREEQVRRCEEIIEEEIKEIL